MQFGQNLKQCREIQGINQTMIAEITGLKQSALSRYEKGDSIPAVDTAIALANSLGVRVDLFFCEGMNSKAIALSGRLKHFEDQLRKMNPSKEDLENMSGLLDKFINSLR